MRSTHKVKLSPEKIATQKQATALADAVLGQISERIEGAVIKRHFNHWSDTLSVRLHAPREEDEGYIFAELQFTPKVKLTGRELPAQVRFVPHRTRTLGGIPRPVGFTRRQGPKQPDKSFIDGAAAKVGVTISVEVAAMKLNEQEMITERLYKSENEKLLDGMLKRGKKAPLRWHSRRHVDGYAVCVEVNGFSREKARLLYRAVAAVIDTEVASDDVRVSLGKIPTFGK